MPDESTSSLQWPIRILIYYALTIAIVWWLAVNLSQYVFIDGGMRAYVTIAALLTLMNLLVRPVLHVLFAPFHFIFGAIATIALNWLFLYLTMRIAENFDRSIVVFDINGGIGGWLIVAIILGLANWLLRLFKL
ncbi:MAG TPA: phage holin family protein [Candidatus Peribacteraceae bacterium]|nr:phage holin family protein [Candidatus Peribacteraceae bacterium]